MFKRINQGIIPIKYTIGTTTILDPDELIEDKEIRRRIIWNCI